MKKIVLDEPVPQLICTQKPSPRKNDGVYELSIPIKYLIKAVEKPAAFYTFKFIGLRKQHD